MKRSILFLSGFLLALNIGIAQTNPVKWSFSAKKTADKTYEIRMTATVQSPWHIYSQTTPDGGPLPTKIIYNKNPLVKLEGSARESGKLVTKWEDVFDINVIYFEGDVVFVQTVKLKNNVKTKLGGKIRFMACKDEQCLPPAEIPFSVTIE